MKYMILTYGAQRDYDAMTGAATDGPVWTPDDFAAMGAFMESFSKELEASGGLVEAGVGGRATRRRGGARAVFAARGAFMGSFSRELGAAGGLVETRGLAAPVHT